MTKLSTLITAIFFSSTLFAQFSIRLVVIETATKKFDDIYVSGTFNNWNPKDEKFKLKPSAGGRKAIVIKDLAAGNYAFKFTRGSFDKVECAANGTDITDRIIDISTDLTLEFSIAGWKDDYPDKPKRYTASPQVKIIDTAFNIPQLNRTRRLWVYLPKSYAKSTQTYPVLYMLDGQNLFNEQTAPFGEWGVDECLDTLQSKLGKECIVIGIDHGGENRLTEYSPYDFSTKSTFTTPDKKGEGKLFLEFIVKTLKPFIDTKYRTKKGVDYTSIAGSSMGGLLSTYAVIQYPQVFGAAGIFSPSYWIAPQLFMEAEKFTTPLSPRFFFYAGGKESNTMVTDIQKCIDILRKKDRYQIRTSINPIGLHSEKYWQQEFASFYTWLMQ